MSEIEKEVGYLPQMVFFILNVFREGLDGQGKVPTLHKLTWS